MTPLRTSLARRSCTQVKYLAYTVLCVNASRRGDLPAFRQLVAEWCGREVAHDASAEQLAGMLRDETKLYLASRGDQIAQLEEGEE